MSLGFSLDIMTLWTLKSFSAKLRSKLFTTVKSQKSSIIPVFSTLLYVDNHRWLRNLNHSIWTSGFQLIPEFSVDYSDFKLWCINTSNLKSDISTAVNSQESSNIQVISTALDVNHRWLRNLNLWISTDSRVFSRLKWF